MKKPLEILAERGVTISLELDARDTLWIEVSYKSLKKSVAVRRWREATAANFLETVLRTLNEIT